MGKYSLDDYYIRVCEKCGRFIFVDKEALPNNIFIDKSACPWCSNLSDKMNDEMRDGFEESNH